ncbi:MAG: hypothetical protein R2697_15795 [Ilumatobacteraceae bacterium]
MPGRPLPLATPTPTWVRCKDRVPSHHPGRFAAPVAGRRLDHEFGADGLDWSWEHAGPTDLDPGEIEIVLHDLTGFDGRCDAIFLTTADSSTAERRRRAPRVHGGAVSSWTSRRTRLVPGRSIW